MRLCNRRGALRALAAAAALCGAAALSSQAAHAAPDAHFVLISHAPDSDSWWNTIKNAIKQADEDFNVQTDYRNPPNGDIADMARLIEQAAARNYDGVIVTIADFDVLKGAISKVTAKHIPLVTINSGTEEQSAQLGAIMHVGQPEYAAGKAAGEKAKAAGIKSFLCVNHYATNPASFERCRGFAEAIGVDFKASTLDAGQDPTGGPIQGERVFAQSPGHAGRARARPAVGRSDHQGTAADGPRGQDLVRDVRLRQRHREGDPGRHDPVRHRPAAVLAGLYPGRRAGDREEGSHHRPGRRSARSSKRIRSSRRGSTTYGLAPSYGPRNIGSGPGFITKDNIDKVLKYAGQYR